MAGEYYPVMDMSLAILTGVVLLGIFFFVRIVYRICFPTLFCDCWLCHDAKLNHRQRPFINYLKVNIETVVEINDFSGKLPDACNSRFHPDGEHNYFDSANISLF